MGKVLLSGILVLAFAQLLPAQWNATAVLPKAEVPSGDTFALRILVSGLSTQPVDVDFSAWANRIPEENILKKSAWSQSGRQWVQNYTIIAFEAMDTTLAPLTVWSHLKDSTLTNPVQLKITIPSVAAEVGNLDPLREIHRAEGPDWVAYWPISLALAAFLAFGIWRQLRKRKKAVLPTPAPLPVEIPLAPIPAEVALHALALLGKEKPWTTDVLAFYTEMGNVLRNFVESAYHLPALESTTRETTLMLQKKGCPADWSGRLQNLLQRTDLVKYAHSKVEETEHLKNLQAAINLIQTAPHEL